MQGAGSREQGATSKGRGAKSAGHRAQSKKQEDLDSVKLREKLCETPC
jgi:hypothetical protein